VNWNLESFSLAELGACRYANTPPWSTLVDGRRLVAEGAMEIAYAADRARSLSLPVSGIDDVRRQFEEGKNFARLIAAEVDGSYVLVEGHTRATAFVGSNVDRRVEVVVGSAHNFPDWHFR
jgi:hypothetical protein